MTIRDAIDIFCFAVVVTVAVGCAPKEKPQQPVPAEPIMESAKVNAAAREGVSGARGDLVSAKEALSR